MELAEGIEIVYYDASESSGIVVIASAGFFDTNQIVVATAVASVLVLVFDPFVESR